MKRFRLIIDLDRQQHPVQAAVELWEHGERQSLDVFTPTSPGPSGAFTECLELLHALDEQGRLF